MNLPLLALQTTDSKTHNCKPAMPVLTNLTKQIYKRVLSAVKSPLLFGHSEETKMHHLRVGDSFCQVLPSQHQSTPAGSDLVFRDRNSTVFPLICSYTDGARIWGPTWELHSIFHSNVLLTCGLRGSKPMYSSLGMMDEITCGRKK